MKGTRVYPFRGGPWDGFVIEYGERSTPACVVDPPRGQPRTAGLYHLDNRTSVYVWADHAGKA